MARINIEESIHKDKRFFNLAVKLGSTCMAMGALVYAWELAQRFYLAKNSVVPKVDWMKLDYGMEIIAVGLAEVREDGVYIKGAKEQFAWLEQRHNAGVNRSRSVTATRDSSGRWSKGPAQSSEHQRGRQEHPASLSPSLSLSLSRSLSRSKNTAKGNSAPPKDAAEASPVTLVKRAFCEGYRKEFGREYPGWGVRENSQAKAWLTSVSIERATELCGLYPGWNDAWVTERGHTFGILVTKYVELDAWAKSAPQLIEKIAQGKAARSVDLRRAVEKEESKRGFEHKLAELRVQEAEDKNDRGAVHRQLQGETQGRVRRLPGDPFSESVFDPGSEGDDAEGGGNPRPLPFHQPA